MTGYTSNRDVICMYVNVVCMYVTVYVISVCWRMFIPGEEYCVYGCMYVLICHSREVKKTGKRVVYGMGGA
jgi:hypothetical protein